MNCPSLKALFIKTRLSACCNSYRQTTLCHDPSSTRSEQIKQRRFYFDVRQARFYRYGASRDVARNDYRMPSIIKPRHGTTILCVRKGEEVCLAGDGQVSQGNLVVKPNAKKIRRLPQGVILGFAGATADCFTLLETLEGKLEEHPGKRESTVYWTTGSFMCGAGETVAYRPLSSASGGKLDTIKHNFLGRAVLIVADQQLSLEVSGVGDVLESHDGILAVGSGGPYAAAAARALYDIPYMSARQICEKAMKIAADMCCHTNHEVIFETLPNTMTSRTTQDASSSLGSD